MQDCIGPIFIILMKTRHTVALILCVAALGLLLELLPAAESARRQSDSPFAGAPTNMVVYIERVQATIKANTAASNMTDQQVLTLMNEAAKTNLGAELWMRSSMYSHRSSMGADIALSVRVLEHLRGGRTNEAIRELEAKLETDVSALGMFLDASSAIRMPTAYHLESLQIAKDYWKKSPRMATNAASDYAVNRALSLLDKK